MKHNRILLGLFCASLAFVSFARAQEVGNGTLHVVRPVMHTEQEEAELCLEFDHDLDVTSRTHVASALKLESGGRNIAVKPQNISIVGNLFCLPSLEHRREYRIVVSGARGTKGEKLASPYGLDFTIPDRQSSLGFIGNAGDEGMTRWQDNDPVLRAINVPYVHIELYRIADPSLLAAAWRDRRQTSLAPSESATFGHDHGQMVWSSDLVLDDNPNKTVEKAIPLHEVEAKALAGLYLVVARAPKKSNAETENLAITGAAWLLRSGLRLRVVRDATGFYGLAEKTDASAAVKNAHLLITDTDGQTLAETRSDAAGIGVVPLAADKIGRAAALIGYTDAGDVTFADLSEHIADHFSPPENQVSLVLDKDFYPLASQASATLSARDAQGHAISGTDMVLALMRADGNVYESFPVPAAADGTARLVFPVPVVAGEWTLAWRRADGSVLAQKSLRVTDDPDAPRIDINADRGIISGDGVLNLTLKSLTADGKPDPYKTGRVYVAWAAPDTIFREWKDFHFGNGVAGPGDPSPLTSFVTDEKGAAFLHLTLTPPDDHALLHNAILSVHGDAAMGMPAPLTLPEKPKEGIVGIKPLAPDARFPENGLARFAIIALDADGHRHGADDLIYQIYEEGRSFDWYQAEGRWNYKLEQQKRRIGGGTLTLGTDGDDIIEWPVAAGTYRLEITDANGIVRAAADFSAGWGLPDAMPSPIPLALTASSPVWQPGQDIQVHFKLDQPSMIDAFVGDDHIRKIVHQFATAGDNTVSFAPEKEWSDHIDLRVETEDPNRAGQITLTRASASPEPVKPVKPPEASARAIVGGLTIDGDFPEILRAGDLVRRSLNISNAGKTQETIHYILSAAPGVKIDDAVSGSLTIPAGRSGKISLSVNAVHAGAANIKLDITGPLRFHANREWTILVMTDDFDIEPAIRQRIEPQQSTSWPPKEKTRTANDNILFLSPAPLYGAPVLLADILDAKPFTTSEIAGVLETLRLWHGTIAAAGLMPETELGARERDLLLRLMARQKPDGGFSPLPENDADFISTSQALMALAHGDPSLAKPAMEQAAKWLRKRLENTWFDESERPERAAAYAALAEADRLDAASLHYFSDTSAQKPLPPLAAVQLAFAFAKINDQPASSFWIDTSGVTKNPALLTPALLPVLADNGFFDVQNLSSAFEALSAVPAKDKNVVSAIESATNILRALWRVQNRKGVWNVTIDTDRRSPKDILVFPIPEKGTIPIIHNTGDNPVFLSGVRKVSAASPGTGNVARHIYQLNGTEVGARKPLASDETYLVILEGSWPDNASGNASVLVHDDLNPALLTAGCLPPPPIEADDSLAWLKSQALTVTTSCEMSGDGIDVLLARKDNNTSPWRVAYLAAARWSGTFGLPSAAVRDSRTGLTNAAQTAKDRIEIR